MLCRCLTIVTFAFLCGAWTRPQLPTHAKTAAAFGQRLDYIIVNVNGEPRLVADGGELAVVRGDELMVKEAALHDRGLPLRAVHVVGVAGGNPRGDDRGVPFTTERLQPKFSEAKQGVLYAVLALSRGLLHGVVYLRVIEPVLRYAEVSINGKVRVLRDGEPLAVRATDQLKVERVLTNLESTAGVLFAIEDRAGPEPAPGAQPPAARRPDADGAAFAIRFTRAGVPFATIPLKVSD